MQIKTILFVASMLLIFLGSAMALPIFTSWYYDESLLALMKSALIMLSFGIIGTFAFKPKGEIVLSAREGIAIVAFSWITAGLAGSLPYILTANFSFPDAFFESVSGFTTTGASVIADIEALPRGLLMWRALTHWLGGMGIIVLTLAILPILGMGGMQLYKAETTGPQKDKLRPRMHDTALYLWLVYLVFTILLTIILMYLGMDWFNALAHAFATLATGGFSTYNTSLIHVSPAIQWTIILFMFLAGVNFSLYYQTLISRNKPIFRANTEFKTYSIVILLASLLITFYLLYSKSYATIEEALRSALFQVVSICTSTGFASADYMAWSFFSQALILFVMVMGACSGSTGGGVKVIRCIFVYKAAYKEVLRVLHPRAIYDVKYQSRSIAPEILNTVMAFAIIYVGISFLGGLFISAFGYDFATSFTASISAFSNTGPGFGKVGPMFNYQFFEAPIKFLLTIIMLIGRLEIFTILLLFIPSFWKD